MNPLRRFKAKTGGAWKQDDTGQTLVEYALIVTLLAMGAFATLAALGPDVVGFFTDLSTHLQNAAASS